MKNLLHLKSCYELGPSFMFTPEVFKKAGPFNSLPGEDYYFAVNCALNNFKFGYIDKVLVNYKIHDNSITAKLKRRELIDICSLEAKDKAQNIIGNIK